jgi:hydroxyacylglutathione hydrolase
MLLERYYDESLAQASYLIGCERTREAIIIDPNRDVERYQRAAEQRRMRIAFVAETHIHADFLSGAAQLAAAAPERARLLLSAHGGDDWSYRFAESSGAQLVRDGDEITVGALRLRVLHTPGHTPEHICFLVTDTATSDKPVGLVSGDFLFVGDVGRPDLLERAARAEGTMESSARELYASLQRLEALPDYLQVWPGHGAGSACGKSLGAMPQTTLGFERLYNPALQQKSEDAFVEWILQDQPEPPPYFATMKRMNRDGPPEYWPEELSELHLAAIDLQAVKPWVVDLRNPREFARGHRAGSINIPMSKSFVTYAGTVLTYKNPIILIARSAEQANTARRELSLIGMDDVVGWIPLVSFAMMNDNEIVQSIYPEVLAERMRQGKLRVIDVRGRSEWNDGHIDGAEHIYLGHLADASAGFKKRDEIVVHCQTGARSSVAASLLMSLGFRNVVDVPAGFAGWRKAGFPSTT